MKDFVVAGECLVELTRDSKGRIRQGFAGDVYSVAVYLKRANPQARVRVLCAVGSDPFSQDLELSLQAEGVETDLLLRHRDRHLGLYAIHNGDDGEREFLYWRSESAARLTLELLGEHPLDALGVVPDCFYLTGITLAVLQAETRERVWPLLESLRDIGATIVFDTNYRSRLWLGVEDARQAFDRMLGLGDLVLPGVDDMQQLYGLEEPAAIGLYLAEQGVKNMVLKAGSGDVLYGSPTDPERFSVMPVERVVDTTAAGDSFSGTLLGHLSRGRTMEEAVASAAALAAQVVQHRGAILPRMPQ